MQWEGWLYAITLIGLVGGASGCVYSLAVAGTAAGMALAVRLARTRVA